MIFTDTLIQCYLEETEDMLQRAEECIMRLEMEYSSADVNELFRIAHTIKGSSHMVGYEDVGNLMHKVEDMLDCARNESILFDQSIASLCFEGLDTVKKMLQCKNEQGPQELKDNLTNDASRISEMIDVFIKVNKKEANKDVHKQDVIEESQMEIISELLSKKRIGENKYYITFFIEEDAPMVSPVIIMILNDIQNIGSLIYSSVDDSYFLEISEDSDIRTFDIIMSTDIDEVELYTYFALLYVEKINIVDLSRGKVKQNDYSFNDGEDTEYIIIMNAFLNIYKIVFSISKQFKIRKKDIDIINSMHCDVENAANKMKNKNDIIDFIADFNEIYNSIMKMNDMTFQARKELVNSISEQIKNMAERAYDYTKGKHIFSIFKSSEDSLISRLSNFIEMLNKNSTLILLIDLSKLTILDENEVKYLIKIKKEIQLKNIEIGIIVEGLNARRIINIFDSIKEVEEFQVFASELDAIFGIFDCEDCYQSISKRLKGVQYV